MTHAEIIQYALHAAEIAERLGEVGYAREMLSIAAAALRRSTPALVKESA